MRARFINLLRRPALIAVLGLTLAFDEAAGASGVADLSLSVSIGPQYLEVYSNVVYTITVSNAGPSAATEVLVSNQIPVSVNFVSATGGSTPTNGVLLVNLGSLAVGAANSIQIVGQITTNLYYDNGTGYAYAWFTNVFQVFADQTDLDLTDNTAAVIARFMDGTTVYTTSTRTIETNLTTNVTQQATIYSTELIAVMPEGTALYAQTFDAAFSDPAVQAAVTQAAGDLTGAGATSYTGPTQTSPLGSLSFVGSSSVTVTNVIGADVSFATTMYVGPQTIMVGSDQSEPYFVAAGRIVFDTLVTSVVTNLVTTTTTDTYLNSAVYMMTGIVAQADLSLSIAHLSNSAVVFWPNIGSYTLQQNSNLSTGSWTTSGYSITTANGTNSITISPPVGNLFFRLRQ